MPDPLILLVEDDSDTREMYATFLEAMGYRVHEAADGFAALKAATCQRPDIVITDLAMPVMDGFHLTRQLRAHEATCSVPIIAVTGHGVTATPVLAQQAGCCRLFNKPFLPDELLAAVQAMLATCQPRCEPASCGMRVAGPAPPVQRQAAHATPSV